MRCQAHYDGSSMKLFSRHMLEITDQFPDVVKTILGAFSACDESSGSSFIIDSEIVGIDGDNLLPFQDLSTRKKKSDSQTDECVQVKVFVFDLMYLNGISLIDAPLYRRKELLELSFKPTKKFDYVQSKTLKTYDEEAINAYLKCAIDKGTEGLMLKQLGCEKDEGDSSMVLKDPCSYEAGTRSRKWLKMKRDYVDGFADTIDVVPIGAWYGNGRKAQKAFLSPVLLAVYDDEEDVFRSISRCMSFTDKMYESMKRFYFHGIPYPENADASSGSGNKGNTEDPIDAKRDDTDTEENDDNKEEAIISNGEDQPKENGDLVNCFTSRPSSVYISTNEEASVWFKPLEVFEVSFADLSLSRTHTAAAGMVDNEGRGVALRFPRFKRRRPDKKPEEATTCSQIAQLFAQQSKTRPGGNQQSEGLL
jgi:DNA ligase 1